MNVNELAERESSRVERILLANGINPELVETVKVSVSAAVAFSYSEGFHAGLAKMKPDVAVLDWSGDRPRINNIKEWIK